MFRRAAVVLVVALAIGVRFGAINWGAPFVYHPDEHLILHPAMNMLREGTPNPRWFQYPTLLLYIEMGIVAALRPWVDAPLTTDPAVNGIGPWDALPAQWPFVLGGRVVVALCAVLGMWCVYRAGSSYSGVPVGLGAALLLVAAPLHNESSHFLTTDVPAATLLTAALALSLAAARAPDARLTAAGWVAGLAAGTKYTAGIALFVPLVVAMTGPPRSMVRRILAVLAAAAVGFLIACPFAVLDFSEFWRDLAQQRRNYLGNNAPGSDWRWYIMYLADVGLLRPSAVACALGLAGMAVHGLAPRPRAQDELPRRVDLALVVVPVAYVAFLSAYPSRAERNLVIVLPFLCLAAANIGWQLVRRFPQRRAIVAYAAIVGVLAAPGLAACVGHNRRLAQSDTRSVALEWIEAHLPQGSRIAREEYTPQVPADRYRVSYEWSLALQRYDFYLNEKVDYLVVSSSVYARVMQPPYVIGPTGPAFYQLIFRSLPLMVEFIPDAGHPGPVIRVYRVPHG